MDTAAMEQALLDAIREAPADDAPRLVLADWLEEQDDPRAELLRLDVELRRAQPAWGSEPRRAGWERRINELLAAGIRPIVPELTNSIGLRMVLIPPGTFVMGSSPEEESFLPEEGPQHEVEITRPFYLGVFPVTQGEYQAVTDSNPANFSHGANYPVEQVSWLEAGAYCERLSALKAEKRARRSYRLPTEAEWEHACRAGTAAPHYYGPHHDPSLANFNSEGTTPVGSYRPNPWGLYDMLGNVWEWCADWYDENFYQISPRRDPLNLTGDERRSIRGGAWYPFGGAGKTRSVIREGWAADFRWRDLGLRVLCEVR
jgi:uncharacterized protein (TIGR02996 family)